MFPGSEGCNLGDIDIFLQGQADEKEVKTHDQCLEREKKRKGLAATFYIFP